MNNLDGYLGAIIDIDGTRFRLARLDWPDTLLADPGPDGEIGATGRFVHMHADDVAEAMVLIVRNRLNEPWATGIPGTGPPPPRNPPRGPSPPHQPSQ